MVAKDAGVPQTNETVTDIWSVLGLRLAKTKIQALECAVVEIQLQQAVGRARLLEDDCKVHLFSNYVLSGRELWRKNRRRVSRGTLDRALRIMDSLLKELDQREIPLELVDDRQMSTQISVLGETFGVCIEEVFDRVERKLTPAQEAEKKRHPWMFDRPEYDRLPTGNLVLRLKNGEYGYGRANWRDGKVQRLESLLNKFIVALFKCAVDKRSARIEREEAEVLRMAESRRKEELRKLQEQERTRLAQLLKDVEAWHQSQKIRAYASAVVAHAEKNEGTDSGQELMEWVSWVSQQADRIDPLCKSPYSVLDETISYW